MPTTYATSDKHYPLEFRRFRKREQCDATGEEFFNHTKLFCQLVDWVCEHEIPGDFTFDSYFTNAEILNHIHGKKDRFGRPRGYVGDLKFNRKICWKGHELRAEEMAGQIDPDSRKPFKRGRRNDGARLAADVLGQERPWHPAWEGTYAMDPVRALVSRRLAVPCKLAGRRALRV